ncbi:histidyl-tRNA synthetase [Legionella birminghamensis]|uniref:Histidine--tRNA ligase n=1 Tax=Legionella birminghamensis TaxID=28083 RepID=A0A378IA54_9GAMM|nr:histidine--tRNA ligase [Legionella birminghamensis]KTC69377.1 histidyl-tRNA synthetase [Legionella birminghamensis]STX31640.1 histidyl-tRNA synthetase [Legionella birminghamensis]
MQAIRGMNDVLPEQSIRWQMLEQLFMRCVTRYGYQEIRFPIVESTQLFKRSIGEITDIVEKEMYTFNDLNGESISLRPEGTAGCLRACLEHGLLHNQQQKLWYAGPMFRHEKPQKGRYRQFHQFGVEALGMAGPAIELELIALCYRLWEELGIRQHVQLQINSLGELRERQRYKEILTDYLHQHFENLDEDSKRRLYKNPLRILDSKNPDMQHLLANAPKLADSLGEESKRHFETLCAGLERLGINYTINPQLVRGLDYYGHTVFEWVTDQLGSQATVCAGGRYDILVEQLGGNPTPAAGFAIGVERMLLLLETLGLTMQSPVYPSFFIVATGEKELIQALVIAEQLRAINPLWQVFTNTAGGSFKSQFKKADKSGADYALIIGENELLNDEVSIKNLRNHEEQITISQTALGQYLTDHLG